MQEETKKRALRMLERRDYARDELVDKLMLKGVDEHEAEAVADHFVKLHLIDDERYAGLVVRHYAAKGFGAARIKNELYRRRVPRELWDEALMELPAQDDTIDRLLRARLKSRKADKDALRRAADALRRRGFSWDEVHAAVERFTSERECQE
jgi:regulatory protein